MTYKYEVHLHSSLSSACGKSRGSEYVEYYKAHGYDGIFITDHFYLGNTCIPRELSWADWVHRFCDSWREAKEAGDRVGLKVFFGWETSYDSEDFLIYGLDENWLCSHPDIMNWDQAEQYRQIHSAGGLVVQAHPFRERWYQSEVKLHPYHSDAFEISNGGNLAYMDALAHHYASEHALRMTSGSDLHDIQKAESTLSFCMQTEQPLNSAQDYVSLILSGQGFSYTAPENRFDSEHCCPYFSIFEYQKDNLRSQITYSPWPEAPVAPKP